VAAVTVGSRNTRYRAARYGLTQTGLSPVGLHQLWLAPSEIQAKAICVARSQSASHPGLCASDEPSQMAPVRSVEEQLALLGFTRETLPPLPKPPAPRAPLKEAANDE